MQHRIWPFILLAAGLAGCDAGHLGNPLTLPVHGVVNAVETASYNQRRARIFRHLEAFGTSQPDTLFDLARTPHTYRAKVLKEVAELDTSKTDWVEHATVIVMVHS